MKNCHKSSCTEKKQRHRRNRSIPKQPIQHQKQCKYKRFTTSEPIEIYGYDLYGVTTTTTKNSDREKMKKFFICEISWNVLLHHTTPSSIFDESISGHWQREHYDTKNPGKLPLVFAGTVDIIYFQIKTKVMAIKREEKTQLSEECDTTFYLVYC